MLSNYDLKMRARSRVKGPAFGISLKISLILILWQIVSTYWDGQRTPDPSSLGFGESVQYLFGMFTTSMVSEIIFGVFGLGTVWAFVEWRRSQEAPANPVQASLKFWGRETLVDVVVLYGLRFLFTVLWTFLLIVPGIIKSFAYSQAGLIFAEDVKNGAKITSLSEYLTRSQDLMQGYKGRFFWLQLSFIGWWILVALTFGIAAIYVIPYYNATMAEFYMEVVRERRYGACRPAGDTEMPVDENDEL